jgi:hypothetical protein
MEKYYKNRKGGRRDLMPPIWRNARINGRSFTWKPEWVLPGFGVLEVDYVYMLRPPVDAAPITGSSLMLCLACMVLHVWLLAACTNQYASMRVSNSTCALYVILSAVNFA